MNNKYNINDVEYLIPYNNRNKSRHERSFKYELCIILGLSSTNAQRMRDWTLPHISLVYQRHIKTFSEV